MRLTKDYLNQNDVMWITPDRRQQGLTNKKQ